MADSVADPKEPLDPLHCFAGYGIELEYMIVDAEGLNVLPVCDRVLQAVAGAYVNEVELGELAWSNELALHVIELKTNGPAPSLSGVADYFQRDIQRMHELLAPLGGRLMPGAMHPWMDPLRETRLWPHEANVIYETYDRIFSCQGHGWSNLQSMHINLPFADDAEFARLHAAIRLILPLLPGVAASSPFADGRAAAELDYRLRVYEGNAARIPSITGRVIPEPVYSRAAYEEHILQTMYRAIAPFDPDRVLCEEWLNSRGAIARFDRYAIEIRVLDIQECPQADLAIAAGVVAVLRALVEEYWSATAHQQAWEVAPLYGLYQAAVRDGDSAVLQDRRYLEMFGFPERGACRVVDLWQHLMESVLEDAAAEVFWRHYYAHGCLARRLRTAAGAAPTTAQLHAVYRRLCECLTAGVLFEP